MTMDHLIVYMFVNSCWLWHKQVTCMHRTKIYTPGMCRGVKTPLFAPAQHLRPPFFELDLHLRPPFSVGQNTPPPVDNVVKKK